MGEEVVVLHPLWTNSPLEIWINNIGESLCLLREEDLVHELVLPLLFLELFEHSLDDEALGRKPMRILRLSRSISLNALFIIGFGELGAVGAGGLGPEGVLVVVHTVICLLLVLVA